jgi:hypothetical protein
MKVAKIVGIVVGAVTLVALLLVALGLSPGVQTWAVRKAVAGQPGMTIQVGRVAAGFRTAEVRDLRAVQDGVVITAKSVTARYSAWDYLLHRRVNADEVIVEDLLVDLRGAPATTKLAPGTTPAAPAGTGPAAPQANPRPAPAPNATRAPFNGALAQARLPMDVRIGRVVAKGRALLTANQTAVFDVQGNGLANGQRGTLELRGEFTDATPQAEVARVRVTGTAGVRIANDRRIDLLELDATVGAEGPKLPKDQVRIAARAEQLAAGGNETFNATVSLVRGTATETLLKGDATYQAASRDFAGSWNLAVRSEQLAAVLAGLGLPEIAASGSGKFSFQPDRGAVAASGEIQGSASHLEKVAAELATIGAVQFRTTFDGGLADRVARLERLQLDLTTGDGRRLAQVSTAQRVTFSLADQRVTLADPGNEFARVTLEALPLAWAQPFVQDLAIESGDLSLTLAVSGEADGSRIRARALQPLALRNVTLRQKDRKLIEQLMLTASPQIDYTPDRMKADIADLNLATPSRDAVTGKLSVDVTNLKATPSIAFTVETQAKIVALLRPYLPLDPGPLTVNTSVEGRLAGDVLHVAKSTTLVQREGGALLASVELQQPLTANLKAATFTVPNPAATAARVKLGEVPLAWAEAFVPDSKFAGNLIGTTLDVSCRSLEDLTVNTTEPVTLRGATATLQGKPAVQALDLTADLTATKRGDVIAYELRRVEVKQGEALLAAVVAKGEANVGKKFTLVAKGELQADAAALMRQPVAAQFATLSRGQVTATFDAAIGDTLNAKATLAARGLVAKQNNQALGDLEVKLETTMKPDGSGTIVAPITMTNASRRSDISVDGAFGKSPDQKSFLFTGRITSDQIFVDDFQPLAAIAPAGSETTEKPPGAATAPARNPPTVVRAPANPTVAVKPPTPSAGAAKADSVPLWNGVQGRIAVDLKKIVYGKDYLISAVRGTAVVTANKLSLDGLEGRFKENPFKLAGGVTFTPAQAKPYALTASADVQGLDIGEILRAANPNEQPTFETKATVTAQLNGNGATLDDLAKNAYGKFELNGTQGVTRLLAKRGGAGTAVNIASAALAILGAAQKNENTAQALSAASELTRLLNTVRFDRVKVQVERAPDLSFKLTSIEIVSPILHTTGSGTVASKSTDDIAKAPMNILLSLGAKGELAYALQKAGLLGTQQDANGYVQMARTFTIGGTPSKPDNSALWSILAQVGLNAFGR